MLPPAHEEIERTTERLYRLQRWLQEEDEDDDDGDSSTASIVLSYIFLFFLIFGLSVRPAKL